MAKKKTITEKIVDAVNEVVHPNHSSEDQAQKSEPIEVENNAGPIKNDLANHPKFDKFKTQGSN